MEIGTVINQYKIISAIGKGGMGEVYKAHDSRLDREVAIKILPAEMSSNADRLKRFEQEAKATSALNHPNILTVHDIGEFAGAPFIVAELLDGEELRQRLDEGPLPLRKVTEYAQQIVSGLSAAHEKGIVHRDLKPENLFITKDDRVKILDFGLAKLSEPIGTPAGSEDHTRKALTNPGVVMGTVGYMSPEQVRGQQTDHRSDIFSFGVILYEMITRRRAFQHETMAETMSAILKEEPPEMTESNPNINPSLERIVRRCLEKKPERRFQSTADLGFALESLSAPSTTSGKNLTTSASAITEETTKPKRSNLPMILGGLALLTVGVLAGLFAFNYFRKAELPKYEQLTFRRGFITHARFSPDGQTIVYGAEWGGNPGEIFTTRGGIGESKSLDLKDADVLSVSSTGELAILIKRQYLGQLIYKGTLARVPILGGTPREILEDVQQADWSPDGKELAVVRSVGGKNRLEYPIGKVLYETDGNGYISHPRISPKGDRIAFMNHSFKFDNRGTVEVVDLAGNKTVLTDELASEEGLAWSADGSEIWFTGSKTSDAMAVYGVSLSGKLREVLRVPADLWLHDINRDGRVLLTRFKQTVDLTGFAPGETRERNLTWLDAGSVNDLSADGKSFVFTNWGQGIDYSVYLGKTDGSLPVRIGDGSARSLSPDGKWVISELFSQNQVIVLPTGAGELKKPDFQGIERPGGIFWLPDSKQIIFVGNETGKPRRSFIKNLETGVQRPITPEGVRGGPVSPDGKSFLCNADGKPSVCSLDENTPPRPIVGLGETDIVRNWTADSRSVYVSVYEAGMLKVSRLDIATGRKEPFKEINIADKSGIFTTPQITITPDGKSYIYSVRRYSMDLYLADGLK